MTRNALSWLAAAGLTVIACSGESSNASPTPGASPDGGTGGTGAASNLPCDVDAVLAQSCRKCHAATPQFGAPMPLTTHAELTAPAKSDPTKKVYELVGTRIHDDAAPMPQPPNPRLSAANMATLDAWIAKGAPAGTEACGGTTPPAPPVTPLSCTPDQKIRPTSKFTMGKDDTDSYVCYGFDTTSPVKRHVIAGAAKIDNPKIVHHVLLYQADASVSGTPTKCGAGGNVGWRLVTGWAPGGKNFELPPEAGFAEEAGTTHWAIQVHYNNAQGLEGEQDETGFDLCSTDQLRANDADILATGTTEISIPPRATRTTTCEFNVPQSFGSIKVISSWPHMHKLGRAEYAKRIRGGAEVMLLDAPTYDFSTGGSAGPVDVDLMGGDTVRTMCKWQNASGDTVKFGEGTADEMCFAFLTYYPKITSGLFHWALPSVPQVSKCTSVDE